MGLTGGVWGYHWLKGVLFCGDCLRVMCCFVLKVSRWKYGYCALNIFFGDFVISISLSVSHVSFLIKITDINHRKKHLFSHTSLLLS